MLKGDSRNTGAKAAHHLTQYLSPWSYAALFLRVQERHVGKENIFYKYYILGKPTFKYLSHPSGYKCDPQNSNTVCYASILCINQTIWEKGCYGERQLWRKAASRESLLATEEMMRLSNSTGQHRVLKY